MNENKTRHTPGPWTVGGSRITAGADNVDTVAWVTHRQTCEDSKDVDRYAPNIPTAEANARLIAAAPDMLAALRNVVAAYDRLTETNGARWYMDASHTHTGADWLNGNGNFSAIQAARSIIAKAEGR